MPHLNCPFCGTDNTQKVSIAYESGVSNQTLDGTFQGASASGSLGSGYAANFGVMGGSMSLSGTQKSRLASRLAPPVRQPVKGSLFGSLGLWLIVSLIIYGTLTFGAEAYRDQFKAYQTQLRTYPERVKQAKTMFAHEQITYKWKMEHYRERMASYASNMARYRQNHHRLVQFCSGATSLPVKNNCSWVLAPHPDASAYAAAGRNLRQYYGYSGGLPGAKPVRPQLPVKPVLGIPAPPVKPDAPFPVSPWIPSGMVLFVGWVFYRRSQAKRKIEVEAETARYTAAMNEWNRLYICLRCGEIWKKQPTA